MFRIFILLVVLSIASSLRAREDPGEFHRFTDKKGQQVVAKLLDVSDDWQTMRIRREDGEEFETEINVLSLDDQQYIKDWIESRPAKTDYRLEIEISRKRGAAEKFDRSSMTYERRPSEYELTFRNLSRESLESARYEYLMVWRDQVSIGQREDGDWDYRSIADEGDDPVKRAGRGELGELAFNRDVVITTDSMEVARVLIDGEVYREDEPIGLMVRVLNAEGTVLAEARSGGGKIEALSWDEAAAFEDPAGDD